MITKLLHLYLQFFRIKLNQLNQTPFQLEFSRILEILARALQNVGSKKPASLTVSSK